MSTKKNEIKKDLLAQLERNRITGKHYLDLVDDYISLWEIKNMLIADIKKRGVSIYWCNGGGQEGQKKNDNTAELIKTLAQMSKIRSELESKAKKQDLGGEGNDEM